MLRRPIHDPDVQDAVAETFRRAALKGHQYRGDGKPISWLRSVARRIILDSWRKPKEVLGIPLDIIPVESANIDDDLGRLQNLIDELPVPQKTKDVLALRVQGYEYAEIGEMLGISMQGAWQRLERWKDRIKAYLGDLEF